MVLCRLRRLRFDCFWLGLRNEAPETSHHWGRVLRIHGVAADRYRRCILSGIAELRSNRRIVHGARVADSLGPICLASKPLPMETCLAPVGYIRFSQTCI